MPLLFTTDDRLVYSKLSRPALRRILFAAGHVQDREALAVRQVSRTEAEGRLERLRTSDPEAWEKVCEMAQDYDFYSVMRM